MARQEIEIDEALAAVEEALECLGAAAGKLNSAKNWGWFDIFGGGGFVSLIKHSKMAEAQRDLEAAQAAIVRLAAELRDVQGFSAMGPDVGGALTTFDFLFDNVFVDVVVQQRIAEARTRVDEAISQCESVRDRLLELRRPYRGQGGLPGGE